MLRAVSPPLSRTPVVLACLLWLVLLTAIFTLPALTGAPDMGDDLTRNTIRLSLLYYAIALSLMLFLRQADWTATTGRGQLARCCWTLAWAALLVHLAMALHHVDHWSHAASIERARQRTGFGEGVYVSYLFTLLWSADVSWWWLRPRRYPTRPLCVDVASHAFMLFIVFNATVVFESGLIRWAGATLFVGLAALVLVRWRRAG